jgi:hypothetical protein
LAAILSGLPDATAFTTAGFSLGLDQRDFRVFNNFTDATANDNQTPDEEFPGALGAQLAIWKGVIEWGSLPHGSGGGDPHQPGGLGSGGANFDSTYQGAAADIGLPGDNVISATSLSLGALLGTVEADAGGWRIRIADGGFVFDDGPGVVVTGVDIQGLTTHLYGRALGLGPSAVAGATMGAFGGVAARSIEADDIAGLQSIYGAMSPTKPVITGVTVDSGVMTIQGASFSSIGNEVWLTAMSPSSGTPVVVRGVASTGGGTGISIALPSGIAPGDVLVKRNGAGHDALSNAWPYHPSSTPPPAISAITPSVVEVLAPGPRVVTVTGTDLALVTDVSLDGVPIASSPFGGSFTVVSDTEIDVELPLVAGSGSFELTVTDPSGSDGAALEVVPVASPVLAIDQLDVVQSVGLDFAVSAAEGDVIFLLVSPNDGPTSLPGILELEIGSGLLSSVFTLKGWFVGPELWRTQHFGPFSGLGTGDELHFEGWVLELASGYAAPFASTNALGRIVTR